MIDRLLIKDFVFFWFFKVKSLLAQVSTMDPQ